MEYEVDGLSEKILEKINESPLQMALIQDEYFKMHSAFHPVSDRWRTTQYAHRLRGKALALKRNRPERSEHPTGL